MAKLQKPETNGYVNHTVHTKGLERIKTGGDTNGQIIRLRLAN